MSAGLRGKLSRRERGIRSTLVWTTAGLVGLTGLCYWIARTRDTDLVDGTASVSSVQIEDAPPPGAPRLAFHDVAREVGIDFQHGPGTRTRVLPEDMGAGAAWGDYDGDGDPDLYLVNMPTGPAGARDAAAWNRLYRNDDAGRKFTDVTPTAGVADAEGFGMGAAFVDLDGDGQLDIYVTNRGPNRLFRSRGDGTFEDIAARAGVADPLWSTGAAFGDYDRDGDVDIYVCNYVAFRDEDARAVPSMSSGYAAGTGSGISIPYTLNPNSYSPQPNRLYANRGNGAFVDVAVRLHVDNPEGRSLAASFCDLDDDGWLDLYVNNDVSQNALFRNLGRSEPEAEVAFLDISAMTGTADPRGSMGLSVADIVGPGGQPDGMADMFITHWIAQENALYQAVRASGGVLEYRDRTHQYRLGEISTPFVGWGCAFVDLDRDGRLDIPVANGSTLEMTKDPSQLVPERLFLFWNGGERFHNLATLAGEACARAHNGRGLAAADFDADGDTDLLVTVHRGQPLLFRNDTVTTHHALTVRLRGPAAAVLGASVELETSRGQQRRYQGADVSYLSMHAPDLLFGLGPDGAARRLRVRWADGVESQLGEVPAGTVTIEHPGPAPSSATAASVPAVEPAAAGSPQG